MLSRHVFPPALCLALVLVTTAAAQQGDVQASSNAALISIAGAGRNDQTGNSVAGIGDVNGDGRPDILVNVFNTGTFTPGRAYVVFGQATPATIDLAALGKNGFGITGEFKTNVSGDSFSVAGGGDVNGDGRPDMLLGDELADSNGFASGSAYVLYGSASSADANLVALGNRGFRIDGGASDDLAGSSVAAAGDVNGDGRADILVGTNPCCGGEPGSVYVIFGGASATNVKLATLGSRGFRIDGVGTADFDSVSLAGPGDVNGDGFADVLIGASEADSNGFNSGSAYVVFGSASPANLKLAALGSRGFRMDGAATTDNAGDSVGSAGDVNGDGRADVLVGADYAGKNGRDESGSAYVVFGQNSSSPVDLGALGTRGFRIDGAKARDHAGVSVAGAGDVNGDGRPDAIVGAYGAGMTKRTGAAYVVFGTASPANVDLASLGERGFRIDGAAEGDFAGDSVAISGDMNGDGKAEVVVGATYADGNGRKDSGAAYVVFGRTSTEAVNLGGETDTTPPRLVLGGPMSQHALRQKAVIVTASCGEPCALKASGTMAITGQARRLALVPASGRVSIGSMPLRLAMSLKVLSQLQNALRHGKRARVTVVVHAVDNAGNARTARRTIRLTP